MRVLHPFGWDKENRVATGCTYVQWFKAGDYASKNESGGEEFLPPEPGLEQ